MYVAVHGGAGVHGTQSEEQIIRGLRRACLRALKNSTNSLDGVEIAISVLEDDEIFNAGYGSNLTISGVVECDATIMNANQAVGSVGAISGVKNPIKLAHAVLKHSQNPDILGRVPPLVLTGTGGHDFAIAKAIDTILPVGLVSPRSQAHWEKWMKRLKDLENLQLNLSTEGERVGELQDTVGAVVWHDQDGMSAGVSSGGILLKYPGRLGEAAIFGAGCWAGGSVSGQYAMGCSLSGTGEHIVRAGLARGLGERIISGKEDDLDIHRVLQEMLVERLQTHSRDNSSSAGILLMTMENGGDKARLWCAFTTESMAIGYASSKDNKAKAMMLRNPHKTGAVTGQLYITSIAL